jgi:protein ImuB
VEVETEHGERSERSWSRSDGMGVAAMVERVRWQLEGWVNQPGAVSSGVVLLRLVPAETMPMEGRQLGFWGEASDADERAVRAVARLVGLAGSDAVHVPERSGGRDPVERYRWVSAAAVDLDDLPARSRLLGDPPHPWSGSIGTPSPGWVADEPETVQVLDASGNEVRVDGRGALSAPPARLQRAVGIRDDTAQHDTAQHDTAQHDIVGWAGPWPLDERWWDPLRRRRRARFQFVTAGGEAVLVSVENGTWRLEARYC